MQGWMTLKIWYDIRAESKSERFYRLFLTKFIDHDWKMKYNLGCLFLEYHETFFAGKIFHNFAKNNSKTLIFSFENFQLVRNQVRMARIRLQEDVTLCGKISPTIDAGLLQGEQWELKLEV